MIIDEFTEETGIKVNYKEVTSNDEHAIPYAVSASFLLVNPEAVVQLGGAADYQLQ